MTETSEKITDCFCNIDNLFMRKSHFSGENTLFRVKMAEFSEKTPNFLYQSRSIYKKKHSSE